MVRQGVLRLSRRPSGPADLSEEPLSQPSPATSAAGHASLRVWAFFLALSFVWGSSFLYIKIGLDEGLGPFTLVSYRLGIATLFLVAVLRLSGGTLPRSSDALGRLFVLAILNVAIPFTLLTWGEQYITSAVTSIFNGLVPLFAIVIAALVLHDEPITLNRLGGLVVGFIGAVLLASPHLGAANSTDATKALVGEIAVTGAALSYAAAAVYARRAITGRAFVDDPITGPRPPAPAEIALVQVGVAGVLVALLAILVEPHPGAIIAAPSSLQAWFSVAWLGVLGSGVAYLLYFRILRAWGATRSTLVTYVMPIVGIALGVAVLGEVLHPAEILGSVLVIGGLVLASSRFGQRRLYGRARVPIVPEATRTTD
jgi:drug/metabolite transporter (DMT)-like permease